MILTGADLIAAVKAAGYETTRQYWTEVHDGVSVDLTLEEIVPVGEPREGCFAWNTSWMPTVLRRLVQADDCLTIRKLPEWQHEMRKAAES